MSAPGETAAYARLAHDVGKYVARIAHNIGPDAIPEVLVAMLARDLYELPGGRPASAVFDDLSAALGGEPELGAARAHLEAIDALEAGVRAGDQGAMHAAAALALEVEATLRALAVRKGKGS